MRYPRRPPPPPKKPDHRVPREPIELIIEDVGARGDGWGRWQGQTVFVPYTAAGERVRVRLIGARDGGLTGQIEALLTPGPDRVEAPCPHFMTCGGCTQQHLSAPADAAVKLRVVAKALARVGLGEVPIAPLERTPPATRRRATFAVRRLRGSVVVGFNGAGSNQIVDLTTCLVVTPAIAAVLPLLREGLASVLTVGEDCDVHVVEVENGLDLLLTGPAKLDLDRREALAALAEHCDAARLSWRPREAAEPEPVAARRTPQVRFGDVAVTLPPGAFLQPTGFGERRLAELVLAGIEPGIERGSVLDLFAGCGSFAFRLAGRFKVHAVEGDGRAVAALEQAARIHSVPVTAERRDLASQPVTAAALNAYAAVVLDPPRVGAAAQSRMLAASKVPVVVMVSCNPATFARDARTLVDGGFALERVVPVDQFLWSPHLEVVGTFRRDH